MVLYASRSTIVVEKSMLFRWVKFLVFPLGLLFAYFFVRNDDVALGVGVKIIIFHVVVFFAFFVITRLSYWSSIFSSERVKIASFDKNKLCFDLDVHAEYDVSKIYRVEFYIPSIFKYFNLPNIKNIIRIECSDGVKEVKTCFEYIGLQNFIVEVNRIINEQRRRVGSDEAH